MTEARVVWERDLHHRASGRAIITPSLLLMPERHSRLVRAAPETGLAIWEARVANPWGWLVAEGGVCVYLEQNGLLRVFDLHTGAERWSVRPCRGVACPGYVCIAGANVLVGGWRGYTDLAAYALQDGSPVWTFPTRRRRLASPLRIDADTVLLTFPDENQATTINARTGDPIAEFGCPQPATALDAAPFVVGDDRSVVCLDEHARILELTNGATGWIWRVLGQHRRPVFSTYPKLLDDTILFEDASGLLCAHSRLTGHQLWEARIQHRRADALPAAALRDGRLVFGASTGDLVVLDAAGHIHDRHRFVKGFHGDLAHTDSGLLVAATGGRVIALQID